MSGNTSEKTILRESRRIRTLGTRIISGFVFAIILSIIVSAIAFMAVSKIVESKDQVVYVYGEQILRLNQASFWLERKVASSRAYLFTGEAHFDESLRSARGRFKELISQVGIGATDDKSKTFVQEIEEQEEAHHQSMQEAIKLRRRNTPQVELKEIWERTVFPKRELLDSTLLTFLHYKEEQFETAKEASRKATNRALSWVIIAGLIACSLGLILVLLIMRAVKETVRTDETLEDAYQRAKSLMDSDLIGIIGADLDGNIKDANYAFCKMVGYSREELLATPGIWRKMTPDEWIPQDIEVLTRIHNYRTSPPFEKQYIRKDGSRVDVRIGVACLGPSCTEGVCFVLDITEKNRALQELERSRTELARAVKLRDEFLSIASHELKTPLTSLKLAIQSLERGVAKYGLKFLTEESIKRHVERTNKQLSRLLRLIEDMLDVTRIESGKLVLQKESFDLCEMVAEVLERFRFQFEAFDCPVDFTKCDQVVGEWDKYRVEQVFVNLCTNAIRYGKGKPVQIRVENKNGNALLSVQDQGIGISEENKERIFNRFERQAQSSHLMGLGLGLYITKSIVEAHGGRTWVESTLGEGSTFFVELPKRS